VAQFVVADFAGGRNCVPAKTAWPQAAGFRARDSVLADLPALLAETRSSKTERSTGSHLLQFLPARTRNIKTGQKILR
jgi:hypothetical protein